MTAASGAPRPGHAHPADDAAWPPRSPRGRAHLAPRPSLRCQATRSPARQAWRARSVATHAGPSLHGVRRPRGTPGVLCRRARAATFAAGAVALVTLLLLAAPAALAHAEPYESEPAGGQRLDRAPAEVVVRFTEPVYEEGSFVRVVDMDGRRVDLDDLTIEHGPRPVMRIGLPPDLPDGAYRILWQTYSRTDDHTVGGAIGFAVGGFEPPAAEHASGADATPRGVAARVLQYVGFSLAFGALVWRLHIDPSPHPARRRAGERALVAGAGLVVLGTLLLIQDTAQATGLAWRDHIAAAGGRAQLRRLLLAGGLLALSTLWLLRSTRTAGPLLAVGWLALAWLASAFGHAGDAGTWPHAVQFLHLVAVATWLGGLALLVWFLRRGPRAGLDVPQAYGLGRRFGRVALACIAAVVGTGLVLALTILVQSGAGPGAAAASPWGRFLAGKILIAAAMLGVALVNRFVFLEADERPRVVVVAKFQRLMVRASRGHWRPLNALGGTRGFAQLAATEAALGAVVLVLAGMLMSVGTPMPEGEPPAAFQAGAQGYDFIALFGIDPDPQAGQSHTVRILLRAEATGEPERDNTCGRDDCVVLRWWPDEEGDAGAQQAVAVPEGDGWWRVEEVLFAVAGAHTMELAVQTEMVFEDVLAVRVPVQSAS